jgi:hypothetical protein
MTNWEEASGSLADFFTSPVVVIGFIVLCLGVLPLLFLASRALR